MANVERLMQLKRVVAQAPEDRFHEGALSAQTRRGVAHSALGWACMDDWFAEQADFARLFVVGGRFEDDIRVADGVHLARELASFFGLRVRDVELLFWADEPEGKREMMARIKAFAGTPRVG